jgi:inosose dehydratase
MDVVNGMRVGTASVNWGFDPYYTWVQTPSFTQMLDEMAQAGYEGTEISYNFPDDAAEIRTALQRRSLQAAATFHAVNLRDRALHRSAMESSMRVADRLQQLGSQELILSDKVSDERLRVAGRAGAENELDEQAWGAMADGLNRIGERLAERGMRAVFHPHAGTYVETRAEIDRLCKLTDPALLGLCPDTGHLAYAGAKPEDVFTDYAGRIGYVHLKDIDAQKLDRVRSQRLNFVDAVRLGMFVELGTGMVSISNIIGALRAAKYSGWIVVEQDAPREPLASATANRRYLKEHFAL